MKKRKATGLSVAAKAAAVGDRILNKVIAVVILISMLYGAFGLYDTYRVYAQAGVDSGLMKYRPRPQSETEPNPTLSELQLINSDVCAWLTVDGTKIDYPVVRGETNMKYVNLAVDGSFSLAGSVFLDCRNSADFTDSYSLLYAHHMEGDVMFGILPDYQDPAFFEKHRTASLFLPDRTYGIEFFACLYTDGFDTEVFNPTLRSGAEGANALKEYLRQNAAPFYETEFGANDRMIALSTCYDNSTNGRILVFGRLVDSGIQN